VSTESILYNALKGLVGNRVYPDVGPDDVAAPYITWQQVGGKSLNFLDTATLPSKANGRYQVNTWAATRAEALTLAKQVENAVRATTSLQPTVLGQPVATTDEETGRKGYRQDFSLWN
jgi:hypothetical protein